ncbi:MAG: glutamine--tRNA ligase/YqeY domain fusion protein [Deltaproteobacteria bacterium]|nr:glutamine--tRNA ligase/YqeY domain fusion protein [Deltaproteobacteria bacterium]MBW2372125.1 glutamine--tRNA ligase/YqeY domain fusion protein [Deltaproteobacteria bacterium]
MAAGSESRPRDFIRQIVADDLRTGKRAGVVTRFPPEPNGYPHIGHAFAICVNYGIAEEFGGRYHLRFDDTNPATEEALFVEVMQRDIRWLGFDWGEHLYFASDYFGELYASAVELIRRGHAFVCDLSSAEIAARRGTLTEPGQESPYRDRPVEESLDLFERMKAGEFEPGTRVLRAKIDMASSILPNRDPVLYRIVKASHHRTGDAWCIYPLYDFAHCLSDSIEGITHSLCSIEFVDHRPLYDWILDSLERECHPQQIEFARLNITHTVLSKRVLLRLVNEGYVSGWDDPRMPTLSGMRRRGVPPTALRSFCADVGVTRVGDRRVQLAKFDASVREELNRTAERRMGVLRPLKVVIENYPEDLVEEMECVNNPEDAAAGTRRVPFSRELWIERDDFLEDPPRKFFRMAPGREVRLRYAYLVTCTEVRKDADGEVVEVRCTYDPETRGGDAPDGRRVKGTLHWVSARHAVAAEARLYEILFSVENPMAVPEGGDVTDNLNPDSIEVVDAAWLEPSVAALDPGTTLQLERLGYFSLDPDGSPERPVLNRTVTLRDTWAKLQKKGG